MDTGSVFVRERGKRDREERVCERESRERREG